jgi:hypothetical protein
MPRSIAPMRVVLYVRFDSEKAFKPFMECDERQVFIMQEIALNMQYIYGKPCFIRLVPTSLWDALGACGAY